MKKGYNENQKMRFRGEKAVKVKYLAVFIIIFGLLISSSVIAGEFSVDQLLIKVLVKEDSSISKEIRVTNNGNQQLSLGVEPTLGIVSVSEPYFSLGPGETKALKLAISGGREKGVFVGKLNVGTATHTESIPVIVDVESRNLIFDANINILPENREVSAGSKTTLDVSIINLFNNQAESVNVEYQIKDLNGNVKLTESESVAVKTQGSFYKTIKIPKDIQLGSYVFCVKVEHNGLVGTSSYLFDIVEPERAEVGAVGFIEKNIFSILIVLVLIFIAYVLVSKPREYRQLEMEHRLELTGRRKLIGEEEGRRRNQIERMRREKEEALKQELFERERERCRALGRISRDKELKKKYEAELKRRKLREIREIKEIKSAIKGLREKNYSSASIRKIAGERGWRREICEPIISRIEFYERVLKLGKTAEKSVAKTGKGLFDILHRVGLVHTAEEKREIRRIRRSECEEKRAAVLREQRAGIEERKKREVDVKRARERRRREVTVIRNKAREDVKKAKKRIIHILHKAGLVHTKQELDEIRKARAREAEERRAAFVREQRVRAEERRKKELELRKAGEKRTAEERILRSKVRGLYRLDKDRLKLIDYQKDKLGDVEARHRTAEGRAIETLMQSKSDALKKLKELDLRYRMKYGTARKILLNRIDNGITELKKDISRAQHSSGKRIALISTRYDKEIENLKKRQDEERARERKELENLRKEQDAEKARLRVLVEKNRQSEFKKKERMKELSERNESVLEAERKKIEDAVKGLPPDKASLQRKLMELELKKKVLLKESSVDNLMRRHKLEAESRVAAEEARARGIESSIKTEVAKLEAAERDRANRLNIKIGELNIQKENEIKHYRELIANKISELERKESALETRRRDALGELQRHVLDNKKSAIDAQNQVINSIENEIKKHREMIEGHKQEEIEHRMHLLESKAGVFKRKLLKPLYFSGIVKPNKEELALAIESEKEKIERIRILKEQRKRELAEMQRKREGGEKRKRWSEKKEEMRRKQVDRLEKDIKKAGFNVLHSLGVAHTSAEKKKIEAEKRKENEEERRRLRQEEITRAWEEKKKKETEEEKKRQEEIIKREKAAGDAARRRAAAENARKRGVKIKRFFKSFKLKKRHKMKKPEVEMGNKKIRVKKGLEKK